MQEIDANCLEIVYKQRNIVSWQFDHFVRVWGNYFYAL